MDLRKAYMKRKVKQVNFKAFEIQLKNLQNKVWTFSLHTRAQRLMRDPQQLKSQIRLIT